MNYQKELDKIIAWNVEKGIVPKLLLHACCAPCSSYVLEYLSKYFEITIFYYNPNIDTKGEYDRRVEEEMRLLREMPFVHPVSFLDGGYEREKFAMIAKGKESLPEKSERCYECYRLRLLETVKVAKKNHFDYFGTTLSVSPHKNSDWLNEIGKELSSQYQVPYLYSDFKKKEGYKRSIELSKKYRLYRQDYCGCVYSKIAKMRKDEKSENRED